MKTVTPVGPVIDQNLHLAIRARELALSHIRDAVEAGLTESDIAATGRRHVGVSHYYNGRETPFGQHDVQIVSSGRVAVGKRLASAKVYVHKVHGEQVNLAFSLHDLYEELRGGVEQMRLI